MKGKPIPYSEDELTWLEARQTLPRRKLHELFCAKFARRDISVDAIKSLCTRKGWTTGRTGRFQSGHEPANKGQKGLCAPGSEKGWFPKGNRSGAASKNYKPIGTERMSLDGYLERKIHDGMPLQSRWRAVHLIRWEAINGAVPEGHCLKCIDGNKANTDPLNWIAIPRAILPRLNGRWTGLKYDDAEPEIKPYILAAARLYQAAKEKKQAASNENG
ncbi:HNH endonuclease [Roseovarius atlanticus]|uniref:HNH endonuclease n=1 Tax=Roseovarius atlanticus TaxID=1641875 RepID=UPI001C95F8EF|nr:HNH endonuclease [Roseovarius atlanticus]MBY5988181.1 HNH endonuclease [Roseovarius atlanticus]MBY6123572.1 HNH endonuclease [Roseovarius atlanticus]MBY6148067.1 HNH endonuclease [Roseovarius atlanticus]